MDQYAQVAVALAALTLLAVESLWPNHRESFDWRWIARALGLTLMGMALVIAASDVFDPWLQSVKLFPAASRRIAAWPAPLSGLLGYYCVTFLVYWWHRMRHSSNLLWRVFHQIHHSPARIEVLTTFYAHPVDFASNAFIISLVAYALLGLDPSIRIQRFSSFVKVTTLAAEEGVEPQLPTSPDSISASQSRLMTSI